MSGAEKNSTLSLHQLGVICGLAAGAWLGAAEAPAKLVTLGFSPFVISLGMVTGVFVARWTVPMALKGTSYVWHDLVEKKHLIVWAVLAGMLWAVANILTVFAIRNVGLSIAFPLWNTNSLVGLFWGWLLFNELKGAAGREWAKVLGGAIAIVSGACLLAYATTEHGVAGEHSALLGVLAALGAGVMWGTMYIPYRKAYISGMNPLSFVTVFTFGELVTTFGLAAIFHGGYDPLVEEIARMRPSLFWLFFGGFCWVLGDLFQQYAVKYVGIGRGIPLSNTNQLWGLAWGALVFGELTRLTFNGQVLVVAGSLIMILGAVAIGKAEAAKNEKESWQKAVERECDRYGMDLERIKSIGEGHDPLSEEKGQRRWWEALVVLGAIAVFVYLAMSAQAPGIEMDGFWTAVISVATLGILAVASLMLWKRTGFS
jgi:drug/metabolite transporter (DMT)-like permease